jgi:ABC-2 type transport system permease protein
MYAGFWGLKIINESQANLSSLGARISVSPIHKLKLILYSFLTAYFLQVIIDLILLFYLNVVLKIDFGNEIGRVILLTLTGSLAGMSVGTLIGALPLKNENAKISIFVMISMLLSFLSGLMYLDIKYIIANKLPSSII